MATKKKKQKISRFVSLIQNNFWYSLGIAILALVSGGMLAYEFFGDNISEETILSLHRIDIAIAWIFLADFFAGLYFAPKKLRHIRRNWLDLLSSIPYPRSIFQALRLIRLGRIARLLRIAKTGGNLSEGAKKIYKNKRKNKISGTSTDE